MPLRKQEDRYPDLFHICFTSTLTLSLKRAHQYIRARFRLRRRFYIAMESPLDGSNGERSPKRKRVSRRASQRDGDTSHIYQNEELPFTSLRPPPQDASNTPQISITRGSDSDPSTPQPPLPSPLERTPEVPDTNPNHDSLLPTADTPRSQRSSQMDSEDEYPGSRSSPVPPETLQDSTPQARYRPKLVLRGHKRGVACVKFSPDGKWIASCCEFIDCLRRYKES